MEPTDWTVDSKGYSSTKVATKVTYVIKRTKNYEIYLDIAEPIFLGITENYPTPLDLDHIYGLIINEALNILTKQILELKISLGPGLIDPEY